MNRYYVMGLDTSEALTKGTNILQDIMKDVAAPSKPVIQEKAKEAQRTSTETVLKYLGYVGAGLAALWLVAAHAFKGR